jgi:hypothetical protein
LYQDVATILKAIPDSLPSKIEEYSLFTYTVYCGARASTAANVQLRDITEVKWRKEEKMWEVKV